MNNVGKVSASTSSAQIICYIVVLKVFKFLIFSTLLYYKLFEPEDGVDAKCLRTFLTSCFICPCLFQPDIIQLSVFQS